MSSLPPETQARQSIDQQLAAAGWSVQDAKEINLAAQLGVAVREFPTATGPADYMLFADGKAIGIVEAKKVGETLSAVHTQAARYGSSDAKHIQRWAEPLPFTYESTGVETYFTDERDPTPRARRVFCFHRPEELIARVQQPDTLRARLLSFPELVTAPLRECQIDAVSSLEKSLSENRPRALIQMATGSGKTYTAVTAAYRLIKHGGAKRILFLVDRGNLGRQTVNEFQQFTTPDDGRKFTELYNVQMLGPAGIDPVAKVTVSTIQRLYSQLAGKELDEDADEHSGYEVAAAQPSSIPNSKFTIPNSPPVPISYNPRIPIEEFDFVIVDECHRSIYNLWKQVLEYFDAFLIGLTATPSKHTLGFFNQNLVTEYPHVQAVADGVNVGYDIYRIRTQITESGSALESGFEYKKRDRLTRAERWKLQDEEETYTNRDLDRSVTSQSQIRTVIRTFREKLFTDLFPSRPARAASLGFAEPWIPKTLIFAKDDNHAEEIVAIVREEFAKGNDFCQKITYRAGAKPEDLIKAFRTAPEFRIAVTVDMIATGTDIKPLECLLFMRDVRSQLYFEQMKGRGTRTIDPTDFQAVTPDAGNKTHFVLVDAVGVTESDKTDSRPLERKPTIAFDKLLLSIAMGARDPDTLSSAANRLARLDRNLTDADREQVRELTGGLSIKQIASNMLQATDPDIVEAASRRFQATYYNPLAPVEITSANLPHWQQDGATYFITFRLVDSLPQENLAQWAKERTLWLKEHPQPLNDEDKAEYNERFTVVMENWLDQGSGSCVLNIPECRNIVENALRHFDGDRYQLGEYAIASNHVHVLVTPAEGVDLSDVLHSWKSFTAKEIIKIEAAASALTDHWQTLYDRRREAAREKNSARYSEVKFQRPVWQKESYDHIVRSPTSLHKIQEYILNHRRSGVPPLSSSDEDKRRDAAAEQLANEAAKPIASNPALRELLDRKRRDTEMTIDHASVDTVLSAGYDTEKAEQLIQSWTQFIEANKDELTALQIIYNRPHKDRHLTYDHIKQLAAAVSKPPYNIAPDQVWRAYENLEGRKPTDNPVRVLTNLITLVRHSIQPDTVPLVPYTEIVNQRFDAWLQQQTATRQPRRSGVPPLSSSDNKRQDAASTDFSRSGVPPLTTTHFTQDHLDWLHMIKDHIATSAAIEPDDFEDVPFNQKGGLAKARKLFGKELKEIIDNLNEVLVG